MGTEIEQEKKNKKSHHRIDVVYNPKKKVFKSFEDAFKQSKKTDPRQLELFPKEKPSHV